MKKGLLLIGLIFSGASYAQVIYSEDFDSGLPGTWTQTTAATDGGWLGGTATGLSSLSFVIPATNITGLVATNDDICDCDKSADRLISPSIDLSGVSSAVLTADLYFMAGQWNSLTEEGSIEISTDGGSTWASLSALTANQEWHTDMIDLTTYVGNADVKISFLFSDVGDWMYGFAMDNFMVSQPLPNDARLNSVSIVRYALNNTNTVLSANVQNMGSNTINSITMDWNDGTSHSQSIAVTIAPGAIATVSHPDFVNYATTTEASIDVTITAVNGGADDDMTNNNANNALHNTVSQLVQKNVLIEEGTGTWCGWCPRGAISMDYMSLTYPDQFIGIAVHNGDPMTVDEYDAGAAFTGFPGCNVDRTLLDQSVSQGLFETYYLDRKDLIVPADLDVTLSGSGSNVILDVSANFHTVFAASNYRLAVVMVEDGVTGTDVTYDQTNYYAGGANGAMGGYESLADPVPAAQMTYNHVGRALLGGYSGQAGSVPTAITDGAVVSYTFNYTVPGTSNRSNMRAVALLIDQTNGQVVNSEEISVANTLGMNKDIETIQMDVFPNPASTKLTVSFEAEKGDYTVSIIDLQGRTVMSTDYSGISGVQAMDFDLENIVSGNYLVSIAKEGASFTKMITVK